MVTNKGKNLNLHNIMNRRSRVMNPEGTEDFKEVDAKLRAWKEDKNFLLEVGEAQDVLMMDNHVQMCTLLIRMVPEKLRDHITDARMYEEGVTELSTVERWIEEYMTRNAKLEPDKKKKIQQVTS